ncbi:hypothetical protein SASPL_152062 [Salvia splendens]|uniref:F-box domain-containing protein n=1 Tax=Salvia splendens TaxID=180675 RepID=A0A8X8W2H4_SALSN|nr:uncharacterized protein LOC121784080 [Salvia splendens]KAG6386885.1 hypothetical protein SASPL_152062 [Salvia splendens]
MNNDVLADILLHLPVQSLLKFRAVCKFCVDVIDSSRFRKLHIHNNRSDETVCLEVILSNDGIQVQHNTKSLISYNFKNLGLISDVRVSLYGLVKGLIILDLAKWNHLDRKPRAPIVICNPFLGQLKLLPLITTSSCIIPLRSVAIGFIDEDYKVVQLSICKMHYCLHAHVYSRSADSWRELAFDNDIGYVTRVKSMCENGHFAHWISESMSSGEVAILSLDMKNEVFKKIMLPVDGLYYYLHSRIFEKDEHLFWRFDFPYTWQDKSSVHIYESRCEGSKLSWMYMLRVELPYTSSTGIIPRWRTGFFVIERERDAYVYDYRAHKFVSKLSNRSLTEYRGSFVSLEKEN